MKNLRNYKLLSPKKPELPQKQIKKIVEYYNLRNEFCGGSLEYLLENLEKQAGRTFTVEDFQFITFEINYTENYYDESNTAYLEVEFRKDILVDNPNYDLQYKQYLEDKDVYDKYWNNIKRENKEKELNEKLAEREKYRKKLSELEKEIAVANGNIV